MRANRIGFGVCFGGCHDDSPGKGIQKGLALVSVSADAMTTVQKHDLWVVCGLESPTAVPNRQLLVQNMGLKACGIGFGVCFGGCHDDSLDMKEPGGPDKNEKCGSNPRENDG